MKLFGKGDAAIVAGRCSRHGGEDYDPPPKRKRLRDGTGRKEALRWNR